tara:strand:+ start:1259 stop:1498 length:240 start_codon:yes stop_codon:yes gene_type:complete
MKPSKKRPSKLTFWDRVFKKMSQLQVYIEKTNPSIDDLELRWVSDRIEYYQENNRKLTKEEMEIANVYWKKYTVGMNLG